MKNGGSAFPTIRYRKDNMGLSPGNYRLVKEQVDGMSLLDYFSGEALKCLLPFGGVNQEGMNLESDGMAICAYAIGQAMIARREHLAKS